ncbi:PREDICTED: general odorant-binding protein 69a-like [Vollenhovia emeryi]|uniref:general odorant-binding protein 69a-like n=1 Tax=Vollenhovia emeryi TaxID=411798 RepID=UPI0005F3BBD3|nr:PREDICTED: general odorant-binding protein 69a-like [Vollenhovia emeryi]
MKGSGTIFFISFVLMVYLQNTECKKLNFEEIKEALTPLRKFCIDRVGTDPKMIENANKGNFSPDRKLKCYYKCMLLNTKVMKNDKLVEIAFKNIVELMMLDELQPDFIKGMDTCHSIATKSLEGCELAYEYIKCHYNFKPGNMFL